MLYWLLLVRKTFKFIIGYLFCLNMIFLPNNVKATYSNLSEKKYITEEINKSFWVKTKFINIIYLDESSYQAFNLVSLYEFGIDYPFSEKQVTSISFFKPFNKISDPYSMVPINSNQKKTYGISSYLNYVAENFSSGCGITLIRLDDISMILSDGDIKNDFYLISNLYLSLKVNFNYTTIMSETIDKNKFTFWRIAPKIGLGIDFNISDSLSILPEVNLGYAFSNSKFGNNSNNNHISLETNLNITLGMIILSTSWQLFKLQFYNPDQLLSIFEAKVGFKF